VLSDLLLVPQPRHLERRGPGAAVDVPVRHTESPGVPAEGYELDITEAGVELRSRDDNGRRYGLALLDQIRSQSDGGRLPGLFVRDWPDFPVRGFMLDISRDRVPTRATLERLVELMALARINQFQLYTEHTFAYRDHETVWRDASPITPDDVRWLDALCRDHGIELVPNQNCFGHMNRWLAHDVYRHRAEAPDGFEMLPGVTIPASVLAPTDDNAAFAHGLFDELLPNFASRRVYIGFDEPFELGTGVSRDLVARDGRDGRVAVYFEHLLRIAVPLVDRGYEVQFAADVMRHEPSLLSRLPTGALPLAWTYEAPDADGDAPRSLPPDMAARVARFGIDMGDHAGFDANVAPLAEAGVPFWVLPGTSSWNSLVGRIDNAVANLIDAAEVGLDRGAGGYLITDWGDNGHLQPPSISFGPLVFGGAVSWSLATNRDLDLPAVLDRYVFGDSTGRLGAALDGLGRLWRGTGQQSFNVSPLQAALLPHQLHLVVGEPDTAKVTELVDHIDELVTAIGRSEPTCVDGAIVRHELTNAAALARHGASRLLKRAQPAELEDVMVDYESCWRQRSRPGGLPDSLYHLHLTLAQERSA
jgi:hypothetical protein